LKRIASLQDSSFITCVVKRTSEARKRPPDSTVAIRYNSVELIGHVGKDIAELADRLG